MTGHNLVLAFDLANQSLVSFQGSVSALPAFRQSKYSVCLYLVRPVADSIPGTSSYETITYTDYDSVRLGLWSDSTGSAGDADTLVLALADTVAWTLATDADGYQYFTATLNVNTTQVADFLGVAANKAAWFAVNLVKGTDLYTVFDHTAGAANCTILSATDEFSGTAIDITAQTSQLTLPLEVVDPASGEIYALQRTSAGVLQFVWTNP